MGARAPARTPPASSPRRPSCRARRGPRCSRRRGRRRRAHAASSPRAGTTSTCPCNSSGGLSPRPARRAIRLGRSGSRASTLHPQPLSCSSSRSTRCTRARRPAGCSCRSAAGCASSVCPGADLREASLPHRRPRAAPAASPPRAGAASSRAPARLALAGARGHVLCRAVCSMGLVLILAPMPRSIWTGAISFGMVTVPVKLYSADQPQERPLPPAQRARAACGSPRSASIPPPARRCPTSTSSRASRSRPSATS